MNRIATCLSVLSLVMFFAAGAAAAEKCQFRVTDSTPINEQGCLGITFDVVTPKSVKAMPIDLAMVPDAVSLMNTAESFQINPLELVPVLYRVRLKSGDYQRILETYISETALSAEQLAIQQKLVDGYTAPNEMSVDSPSSMAEVE